MRATLAIAISACLYYFSAGLGEVWPLAWIAPVPVLILAFGASARTAALAAFAAYFLGSLNLFTYLVRVAPAAAVVVQMLLVSAVFAAVVLLARLAFRRLPPWAAAFAFPAAWTSYEFLLSLVSPHGTALSLAYSQTDFLPLMCRRTFSSAWAI